MEFSDKKTLAFVTDGDNIIAVTAKSVTGIGVPQLEEADNTPYLEICVFFCVCNLPVMAGRSEHLRVRRFLLAVTPIRSTCHPKIGVFVWWGLKPTIEGDS